MQDLIILLLPHGEQSRPVFSRLHALVEVGLNYILRLSNVLGSLLVARQLQVLVNRVRVVLLLLIVQVDDLLGSLDGHHGLTVHRVRFLESAPDFHIDLVVVGKELLRKGFLLGRCHLRRRLVDVGLVPLARHLMEGVFLVALDVVAALRGERVDCRAGQVAVVLLVIAGAEHVVDLRLVDDIEVHFDLLELLLLARSPPNLADFDRFQLLGCDAQASR